MNKLTKALFDLICCNTIIEMFGGAEFWEDLIISIVVVILNCLILPLLKKLINKIVWLSPEEKKHLQNETEKVADKIEDELDKNKNK